MSPRELPIYELEERILLSLRAQGRLVVQAPTGSGKSTQLPQMLLRAGLLDGGQVIVLQPRRLAARLLARRVAEEVGAPLGDVVGYQIRLDSKVSARTRIRFVTEGILLRQMSFDPQLRGVKDVAGVEEAKQPSDEEFAGAKVTRETTMRQLRFTDEALANAKAKASREAAPYLTTLSLDTKVGDLAFFKGAGCDQCSGTGLKGRQGVYEVMPMSPKIRRLIVQNAGAVEIRDAAIDEGMLTLRMDGWLKVLKGITTLEQVIRETSA